MVQHRHDSLVQRITNHRLMRNWLPVCFTSWSGSGTGSYSGSSASASVTMNNAITETANWQLQSYLTVSSSVRFTCRTGLVQCWNKCFLWSDYPTPCGSGCQYVFTSWSGSGSGSYPGAASSSSVTMNNAITETANWQLQYVSDYECWCRWNSRTFIRMGQLRLVRHHYCNA